MDLGDQIVKYPDPSYWTYGPRFNLEELARSSWERVGSSLRESSFSLKDLPAIPDNWPAGGSGFDADGDGGGGVGGPKRAPGAWGNLLEVAKFGWGFSRNQIRRLLEPAPFGVEPVITVVLGIVFVWLATQGLRLALFLLEFLIRFSLSLALICFVSLFCIATLYFFAAQY